MARKSRKEENLKKILDSILVLGTEVGFEKMAIADIAKRADISPGTLYIYFKDKNEMMLWVFRTVGLQIEEHLLDGFKANDSVEKRVKIGRAHV